MTYMTTKISIGSAVRKPIHLNEMGLLAIHNYANMPTKITYNVNWALNDVWIWMSHHTAAEYLRLLSLNPQKYGTTKEHIQKVDRDLRRIDEAEQKALAKAKNNNNSLD